PICLELLSTEGERQKTYTSCRHAFCRICLLTAIAIKPYCPMCRSLQPLPESSSSSSPSSSSSSSSSASSSTGTSTPTKTEWNVGMVRKIVMGDMDSEGYRQVLLDGKEKSNIFVRRGAKINVAPNMNMVINGKRVQ
ncbi:hypothetical protein GR268_47560, partial [Rhizobium leguminosarum]|nr:hypothetical protein [Rhizobium leguminosarum]